MSDKVTLWSESDTNILRENKLQLASDRMSGGSLPASDILANGSDNVYVQLILGTICIWGGNVTLHIRARYIYGHVTYTG